MSGLNSFVAHAGGKRVTAIMPHHVERWIDRKYSHCSSTTKNNLMKAVACAIHWGIKRRFIKHNPIAGMDKPARKPRETVLTAEQFAQLLSLVKDQEFRDYLTFVWLTGCRAMEIRIIEKRHVDGNVITLPASEAKGGKHPRVIFPNDAALKIIKRLCAKHPTGPLFRTPDNKAWTANVVRLRFKRRTAKGKIVGLAAKLGIPGLCATTLRHSWATNALKNGLAAYFKSCCMVSLPG